MAVQTRSIWLIYINGQPLMCAGATAEATKEEVLKEIRMVTLGSGLRLDAKNVKEATDRDLAVAALAVGLQIQTMLAMATGQLPHSY
jgi:hypothetical protein